MSEQSSFPTIIDPSQDPESLQEAVRQLKEAVEVLSGQRGDRDALFGRFGELANAIAALNRRLQELYELVIRRVLMLNREVDGLRVKPGVSAQFEQLFNKVSTLTVDDLQDFQEEVAGFLIEFGAPQVVDGLPDPATWAGAKLVYDTVTGKLYELDSGQWSPVFDAVAVQAEIDAAIAAGIAASNITGQLTDTQIAAVDAAKLTGQITSTQITDGAITTPKIGAGQVSTAALAAGAVTADTIGANAITAVKIQTGAVEAAKIAAGAVLAEKIAAGAVIADKIAANAIVSDKIQANAVTAGKVAAGAIGADQIVANAIIAGKIAAGAIDGIQITGSVIRTNSTTTRVELSTSGNSIEVFRNGSVVARLSAPTALSNGVLTTFPTSGDTTGITSIGSGTQIAAISTGTGVGVLANSSGGIGMRGVATGVSNGVKGECNSGIGTYGQGLVGVVGRGGSGNVGVRADRDSDGAAALGQMQASAYINFTGAHMDLIAKDEVVEPGDILVSLGDPIRVSVMDALIRVGRSTGADQPAAGVYVKRSPLHVSPLLIDTVIDEETNGVTTPLKPEYEALAITHELAMHAALGEGCMNICGEGGDIAIGDYIVTASIPGKGMKKANNTHDNTVVAKAREAVTFTGPTEVKFVAVVFLCG